MNNPFSPIPADADAPKIFEQETCQHKIFGSKLELLQMLKDQTTKL